MHPSPLHIIGEQALYGMHKSTHVRTGCCALVWEWQEQRTGANLGGVALCFAIHWVLDALGIVDSFQVVCEANLLGAGWHTYFKQHSVFYHTAR